MPQDTHETAPTQFAEAGGIRFAYRRFGRCGGTPLLLLNYSAANLDKWDPKVTNGFAADRDVILFDYPGIGGDPLRLSRHRRLLRRDAIDRRGTDQGLCRILPHDRPDTV
jgi:pimeloyl-ACP methyl ester carboxylesterase